MFFKSRNPVRVVIYGEHSPDWMRALSEGAPVWENLIADRKLLVEHVSQTPIPQAQLAGALTIVVPLMEEHTESCPPEFPALIPTRLALRTFRDKGAFAEYAAQQGLSARCPVVYPNSGVARFPCVLKRTDLNAGIGVVIAESGDHLKELLQEPLFSGYPYILQSLVPGDCEYVTHCICDRGRIVWHCSYAYDLDPQIRLRVSGSKTRRAEISPAQLAELGKFLAPLAFSGPCNIDHKVADDGHVIVFEINPRLGGSLMYPENLDDLRAALSSLVQSVILRKRAFIPRLTLVQDFLGR